MHACARFIIVMTTAWLNATDHDVRCAKAGRVGCGSAAGQGGGGEVGRASESPGSSQNVCKKVCEADGGSGDESVDSGLLLRSSSGDESVRTVGIMPTRWHRLQAAGSLPQLPGMNLVACGAAPRWLELYR